jgi:hypothetical protein
MLRLLFQISMDQFNFDGCRYKFKVCRLGLGYSIQAWQLTKYAFVFLKYSRPLCFVVYNMPLFGIKTAMKAVFHLNANLLQRSCREFEFVNLMCKFNMQ